MDSNNLMNNNQNINNENNNLIKKKEKRSFLDIFVEIIGRITLIVLFLFIVDYAYSLMFADKPIIVLKQENNKYSSILYDMYICKNGKAVKLKNEKFACEEIDGIDIDNNNTNENNNTESNNQNNNTNNNNTNNSNNNTNNNNTNNTTTDKNKTNENTKNDNTTTKDTETKKDNNIVNDNNKSDTNKDVPKIDKDKLILKDNQNTNSNIKIEDRQKGDCAQALDYYYKDNEYEYYFTCKKSNSVYIIKDGKEYTIKYALNNNIVTMQELIDNGFNPLKKSRNLVDK